MTLMNEIQEGLKERLIEFCKDNDILYLGIFGSVAKGCERGDSDIDIIIKLKKRIGLFGFIEIQFKLEKIFGRKVDLITEKSISPHMKENVMDELETLYDAA